jgi:hypothetical protein
MATQRQLQRRGYDCRLMVGQRRLVRSLRTLPFPHKVKSSATVKHVQQNLAKESLAMRNDLRNSSHLARKFDLMLVTNKQPRRTIRSVDHPHLPHQQHQVSAHTSDPLQHNQLYQLQYPLCSRARRENPQAVQVPQIARNGTADLLLRAIRLEDQLYHTSHLLLDLTDPRKEHWHLLLVPCPLEASVLIDMA